MTYLLYGNNGRRAKRITPPRRRRLLAAPRGQRAEPDRRGHRRAPAPATCSPARAGRRSTSARTRHPPAVRVPDPHGSTASPRAPRAPSPARTSRLRGADPIAHGVTGTAWRWRRPRARDRLAGPDVLGRQRPHRDPGFDPAPARAEAAAVGESTPRTPTSLMSTTDLAHAQVANAWALSRDYVDKACTTHAAERSMTAAKLAAGSANTPHGGPRRARPAQLIEERTGRPARRRPRVATSWPRSTPPTQTCAVGPRCSSSPTRKRHDAPAERRAAAEPRVPARDAPRLDRLQHSVLRARALPVLRRPRQPRRLPPPPAHRPAPPSARHTGHRGQRPLPAERTHRMTRPPVPPPTAQGRRRASAPATRPTTPSTPSPPRPGSPQRRPRPAAGGQTVLRPGIPHGTRREAPGNLLPGGHPGLGRATSSAPSDRLGVDHGRSPDQPRYNPPHVYITRIR